ncbi:MAG: alpha/beta hydrolase family protein [Verrucomicrobiales bacterium]
MPLQDASGDGLAPGRLPRDQLLVYRGASNTLEPVRTVEDWGKRRSEIMRGVTEVMGPLPSAEKRCPLEIKTESETDCGTYLRRLITYASEPGTRTPAWLLLPKAALANEGGNGTPGALCPHPTNDVIGHDVVVGLGEKPNRAYAAELAERGYVCIAPSYPHLAKYRPDLRALGYQSGTMKAIWDNIRALDVIESLPFVARGRHGAIGHSLGGHNSVFTAVFDDRLALVVSSCGLDSFPDYYRGDPARWQPGQGWCQERYMPRLVKYAGQLERIPFDFHELIGALAPRAVFISAPLRDENFRADSVDRIGAAAAPVYQLFGKRDNLIIEHPDCGHDFPDEIRQRAYALFDQHLKSAKPAR